MHLLKLEGRYPMQAFLTRRDPSRNMARYYLVDVQRDLFGQFAAVRQWGRIGASGRIKEDWFENERAAVDAATRLIDTKVKRGYTAHSAA